MTRISKLLGEERPVCQRDIPTLRRWNKYLLELVLAKKNFSDQPPLSLSRNPTHKKVLRFIRKAAPAEDFQNYIEEKLCPLACNLELFYCVYQDIHAFTQTQDPDHLMGPGVQKALRAMTEAIEEPPIICEIEDSTNLGTAGLALRTYPVFTPQRLIHRPHSIIINKNWARTEPDATDLTTHFYLGLLHEIIHLKQIALSSSTTLEEKFPTSAPYFQLSGLLLASTTDSYYHEHYYRNAPVEKSAYDATESLEAPVHELKWQLRRSLKTSVGLSL